MGPFSRETVKRRLPNGPEQGLRVPRCPISDSENQMPQAQHDQIEVTKTEARQGTGPRQMVSVLTVSIGLAILAGAALLVWFYVVPQPPPPT